MEATCGRSTSTKSSLLAPRLPQTICQCTSQGPADNGGIAPSLAWMTSGEQTLAYPALIRPARREGANGSGETSARRLVQLWVLDRMRAELRAVDGELGSVQLGLPVVDPYPVPRWAGDTSPRRLQHAVGSSILPLKVPLTEGQTGLATCGIMPLTCGGAMGIRTPDLLHAMLRSCSIHFLTYCRSAV